MSIRSFVVLTSALLMTWLGMAFVHTPVVRSGIEPVSADVEKAAKADSEQVDELAVSVSP